jgi:predicted enzyme related to lactoylglutathione lyase
MTVVATTAARQYLVHGSPNWVDLQTTDADQAKAFYRSLFGWRFRNRFSLNPVDANGAGSPYPTSTLMAMSNGQPTAEIIQRTEQFDDMHLPASWYPYIYVVDLAATLRRVEAAGGTVIAGPTTRGSLATVATIADPSEAVLCLWQPRDMSGAQSLHTAGALTWIELETPDLDSACRFYHAVFDWTPSETTGLPRDESDTASVTLDSYTVFSTAIGRVAGALRPPIDGIPASWCPAFAVIDTDIMTSSAARHGGVVMAEPYDLPIGRQSVVIDPGGAPFSLLGPRRHLRKARLSALGYGRT